MENKQTELRAAREEQRRLQSELETLQTQFAGLQETLRGEQTERGRLQTQVQELTERATQLPVLRSELERLQTELNRLERAGQISEQGRLDALEEIQRLEQLQREFEQRGQERERELVTRTEQATNIFNAFQQMIQGLQNRLGTQNVEIDALRTFAQQQYQQLVQQQQVLQNVGIIVQRDTQLQVNEVEVQGATIRQTYIRQIDTLMMAIMNNPSEVRSDNTEMYVQQRMQQMSSMLHVEEQQNQAMQIELDANAARRNQLIENGQQAMENLNNRLQSNRRLAITQGNEIIEAPGFAQDMIVYQEQTMPGVLATLEQQIQLPQVQTPAQAVQEALGRAHELISRLEGFVAVQGILIQRHWENPEVVENRPRIAAARANYFHRLYLLQALRFQLRTIHMDPARGTTVNLPDDIREAFVAARDLFSQRAAQAGTAEQVFELERSYIRELESLVWRAAGIERLAGQTRTASQMEGRGEYPTLAAINRALIAGGAPPLQLAGRTQVLAIEGGAPRLAIEGPPAGVPEPPALDDAPIVPRERESMEEAIQRHIGGRTLTAHQIRILTQAGYLQQRKSARQRQRT